MHTKIIELKVYDMVLVFSFFKLTKNSVMFHLMYIFFVSSSLLSFGNFLRRKRKEKELNPIIRSLRYNVTIIFFQYN